MKPKPDPDCRWCKGTGVAGGCGRPDCDHAHTFWFCECVDAQEDTCPRCGEVASFHTYEHDTRSTFCSDGGIHAR